MERVGDEDHARLQRDLVAAQAVRVALAVHALVVVADPRRDVGDRPAVEAVLAAVAHRLGDLGAVARMTPHELELLVAEPARGREDRGGDPQLADVVQLGGHLELAHLGLGQVGVAGHEAQDVRHAVGVAREVVAMRIDRLGEEPGDLQWPHHLRRRHTGIGSL